MEAINSMYGWIDQSIAEGFEELKPTTHEREDGTLICNSCGEPRSLVIDWLGEPKKVPCACTCSKAALKKRQEEEAKEQLALRVAQLRQDGIRNIAYRAHTFAADDAPESRPSVICRRYVDRWKKVREENLGLLLYGDYGTGKSFYAAAIANALIDRGIPAVVTRFPQIINVLQGTFKRDDYIWDLMQASLLVIDDLGAERDSAYGLEQVYGVIDARINVRRPLIVTTNLTMNDLQNPSNAAYGRIYDRVLQMCQVQISMTGPSKRKSKDSLSQAQRALWGND